MRFGLFNKRVTADLVLQNGHIMTMDPDMPRAEAIACKDGKILAVGSSADIQAWIGEETHVLDARMRLVTPGLIERNGSPLQIAFEGQYVPLHERMDVKDLVSAIQAHIGEHPAEERCIAYGYDASNITDTDAEWLMEQLNQTGESLPIVLIASDGLRMTLNTCAKNLVEREAEEHGITSITPVFVANVLLSADIDTLLDRLAGHAFSMAHKGYTSEFAAPFLSHFEDLYRSILVDAYSADILLQRYFGSLLSATAIPAAIVANQLSQKDTACAELDGLIRFQTLYIQFDSRKPYPFGFDEDHLRNLCTMVADRGYHICIEARDHDAALFALTLLSELKSIYKKCAFAVIHDATLSEDERSSIATAEIYEYALDRKLMQNGSKRSLEQVTLDTAKMLGIAGEAGCLRTGYAADITIWESKADSWQETTRADTTILAGRVVYSNLCCTKAQWLEQLHAFSFPEGDVD